MIPKIIHYCWVGRGPHPQLMQKCLESWKEILPEYEIMVWDEDSFDISNNRFTAEAYQARKFAFVSDYVRLYALFHHGGIYMDTDVEILKPIDSFLHHRLFSGFESSGGVPTGLIGAEKGHPWLKELLAYYDDRSFFLPSGEMDLTPNVIPITESAVAHGLLLNNQLQVLEGDIAFYPSDYFCPPQGRNRHRLTANSHAIHHFAGSWGTPRQRFFKHFNRFMRFIFGGHYGNLIASYIMYATENSPKKSFYKLVNYFKNKSA